MKKSVSGEMRRMLVVATVAVVLGLSAAARAGDAVIIDHNDVASATTMSATTVQRIGQSTFFFSHASVGRNMLDGMRALHASNPSYYQLSVVADNATPPTTTTPGTIYEYDRGNPGWQAKMNGFVTDMANGWGSGKVDFAMDKLCYIDQSANVSYYLNIMSNLEATYPQTTFIYMTMPLMTGSSSDNTLRNQYNNAVRDYVQLNGKVLFDLADIESHTPTGAAVTYSSGGVVYQSLYSGYSSDGGHLNSTGQERAALGWYALAAEVTTPEPATILLLGAFGAAVLKRRRA